MQLATPWPRPGYRPRMKLGVFLSALAGMLVGAAVFYAFARSEVRSAGDPRMESTLERVLALDKKEQVDSAGIDLLNQTVLAMHWWCLHGDQECERDLKACQDRPGRVFDCLPERVAYCNDVACMGSLELCIYRVRVGAARGRCIGVE